MSAYKLFELICKKKRNLFVIKLKIMDKYKELKILGDGAFGTVTKCQNTQTSEIVAIKKMKQKFSSWEDCMQLKELQALRYTNN